MTTQDTGLSEADLAELEHTLEHFNASHADTMLLLARHGAGCAEATSAEATAVDATGLAIAVTTATGPAEAQLEFDRPATTPAAVRQAVVAQIGIARARAGDAVPETSMERERRTTSQLSTHPVRVVAVADISPNLREVTVHGDLEDFAPAGGDHFVYVIAPTAAMTAGLPAGLTMQAFLALPDSEKPVGAYYTIRRWDPEARTATLWVVLHDAEAGVAGWAQRCRPGDEVAIWGPRGSFSIANPTGRYVLVADESGLGAVASLLDQIGGAAPVTVIAETIDPRHRVALPSRPNVTTTWVFRGVDEPGTGTRLLDQVRSLTIDPDDTTVFAAGESRQVTSIRRYVRHERSLPPDQVYCIGYWRR